jgi:peptidoglycan/xylan/chitin deacetylase (PgdA/CDA1 family)
MRGTFFVVTGLVGKPGYLTWDGVRQLAAAGMEIGSHTVSHAHLAELSDEQVRRELTASKAELEAQLHAPVALLAYPYNSVRKRIVRAAHGFLQANPKWSAMPCRFDVVAFDGDARAAECDWIKAAFEI